MDYITRYHKQCSKCGRDNLSYDSYCSQCGNQLFYKVELLQCSKCGTWYCPSEDKYCGGCGAVVLSNGTTCTQQEIKDALSYFRDICRRNAEKTPEQLRAEEEERRRQAQEDERRKAKVVARLRAEAARAKAEADRAKAEADRIEKQKAEWRSQGRCQHCGGKLKGFWTVKCQDCGRTRDYIP